VFASSGRGVIAGGVAGLAASLAIAYGLYHLGMKLNLAVFFRTVGALLMVFAAGILADAIENLQDLGWLPFLTHPLWSTAHQLSEDSTLGDILHVFVGYADTPTGLQVLICAAYVIVAVGLFFRVYRSLPGLAARA